jgi:uncharacterized protein with HEPN domain
MKKDDLTYLYHIRDNINDIIEFTAGDFDNLYNSDLIKKAVERSFQIIGEAASRLSEEFKLANNELNWRKIKDFRNKIVHDYFDIDYETVWSVIQNDLPNMSALIEKMIKEKE